MPIGGSALVYGEASPDFTAMRVGRSVVGQLVEVMDRAGAVVLPHGQCIETIHAGPVGPHVVRMLRRSRCKVRLVSAGYRPQSEGSGVRCCVSSKIK